MFAGLEYLGLALHFVLNISVVNNLYIIPFYLKIFALGFDYGS